MDRSNLFSPNKSDVGGFFANPSSQENTDIAEGPKRIQNVVPVSVQQINNMDIDDFKLFGMPVHIIKLVGILRSIDVQTTRITYKIEDFTGGISAVMWLDVDHQPVNFPNVKEDNYVELYGSLRHQNDEKFIMVLKIFPVTDCNVITTHLLSFIYIRLYVESRNKKMITDINTNNPGAFLERNMSIVDDQGMSDSKFDLTPLQQQILQLVKTDKTMDGISIADIVSKFPGQQRSRVEREVEFLMQEGHIYSTVDQEHFKNAE